MMIGLTIVAGLLVYLILSLIVIIIASRAARTRGRSGLKWGLAAGLVMYLLVFWDWLPTGLLYRNYCSNEAGFTLYKTLDEWKKENPGVAKTLHPIKNPKWEVKGDVTRVPLNQRFVWETIITPRPLSIRKKEERIVDTRTGEVLASYTDFYTDFTTLYEIRNFHDLKVWMSWKSCERDGHKVNRVNFNNFEAAIEGLGGRKE